MSDFAAQGFAPSSTFLSRLMVSLDRWLLAFAETTIRNGDVSRCEI
jgi:hypothetical protein